MDTKEKSSLYIVIDISVNYIIINI